MKNNKFDYSHSKIWIAYAFGAALSFTISNEAISEITSKTGPVCIFYFSPGGVIAGVIYHFLNCIKNKRKENGAFKTSLNVIIDG